MDSPDGNQSHDMEQDVLDTTLSGTTPMRGKSGRPKALVWEFFDDLGRDHRSHRHVARCRFCQYEWPSARVSQLKNHVLVGCKKIDPMLRAQYLEGESAMTALEGMNVNKANGRGVSLAGVVGGGVGGVEESINKALPLTEGSGGPLPLTPATKINGKRKLDQITPPAVAAEEVHVLLLKWLLTSALPFHVIDNPFFAKALRSLNPSYLCPSSLIMAGPFLQREHQLLQHYARQLIVQQDCFSLGLDGWYELDGRFVMAVYLLFKEKRSILWKIVVLSEPSSLLLADRVREQWQSLVQEFGREKIVSVVSSQVPEVFQIVHEQQEEMEGLLRGLCLQTATTGIILAIASEGCFLDTILSAQKAVQCILSSDKLMAILSQTTAAMQAVTLSPLVAIIEDDVTSVYLSLRSVAGLERVVIKMLNDGSEWPAALQCFLSQEFWSSLSLLCALLAPLHTIQLHLLAPETCFSEVIVLWAAYVLHMERLSAELGDNSLRSTLINEINQVTALLDPNICRLALFLDPRYRVIAVREEGFKSVLRTAVEVMKARGLNEEDCRVFAGQWFPYKDNASPYCDASYGEEGPRAWWLGFTSKPGCALLSSLSLLIADLPVQLSGSRQPLTLKGERQGMEEYLKHERNVNVGMMKQALRTFFDHSLSSSASTSMQPTSSSSSSASSAIPSTTTNPSNVVSTHRTDLLWSSDEAARVSDRSSLSPDTLRLLLLQHQQRLLDVKQHSSPADVVLHRLPGLCYEVDVFTSLSQRLAQGEGVQVIPNTRRASGREDFSVDDLIMEFDA
eukprot:gene1246-1358_t